jgi:transcription factor TFIIIB component B''
MKSLVEARKFRGRDDDKDDTQSNKSPIVGPSLAGGSPAGVSQQEGPTAEDGSGQGFDYSQGLATSRFDVQVRIGPNGETFIDEESLFVDRNHEDNTEQYTHIEESEHTKFVNSGTYGKKVRGSRWGASETELFYHASRVLSSIIIPDLTLPARLSQFGENYELISYVLPGRDRKSCKNKFKSEDRKSPSRITYCLNNRIPYGKNVDILSR